MKNKMIIAVLAILMISGTAWAQRSQDRNGPRPEMKEKRMGNPMERMAAHLELSESQQQKIEDIHLEYAKKNQPVRNELNELEARLQTLTTVDNPDTKAIKATVGKIGDAKETLMLNRTLCQLDIRAQLDDIQRLKFDRMKSDMRSSRKGFGNRRG